MKKRQFNTYKILGTTAVVDISTPKHPDQSMLIDLDVWLDLLDRGIGRVSRAGNYAQTCFDGRPREVHKIITPHFKLTVDHVNHDSCDNRMSNLRDVTQGDNQRNQSLNKLNKSGYAGIIERKGVKGSTWKAQINNVGNGTIYLGTFKSKEKAIAARKAAEVKLGFHKLHGKVKV
tara:strand:+ start:690 stop:1214 length:525 start_codon:yes stop_codon:yes gene_type:complete